MNSNLKFPQLENIHSRNSSGQLILSDMHCYCSQQNINLLEKKKESPPMYLHRKSLVLTVGNCFYIT